jgi:hypothetical protein
VVTNHAVIRGNSGTFSSQAMVNVLDIAPQSAAQSRRGVTIMTDKTIDLDLHRGLSAQHETELRRLVSEVEANQAALRRGQEEVERQLLTLPATTWPQAAEKARYLLGLYADSITGGDARVPRLITAVLEDFDRLSRQS